jgi:hypothetical protein
MLFFCKNFIFERLLKSSPVLNWVDKMYACNLALWQIFNFPGKLIFTAEK